jgi:hypothetical protein
MGVDSTHIYSTLQKKVTLSFKSFEIIVVCMLATALRLQAAY